MRYTHRPGFCSWMQWFFFFSSGGSLSSLFQCSGGTSSLLSSLFSLIEWVWRRTAGLWMYAREGKTEERREGQPIPTPIQPPCTAILRPQTPPRLTPQDENSWSAAQIPKFQMCPAHRQNNSIQIHTHTHAANPPPYTRVWTSDTHTHTHRQRPHLVSFKLTPHSLQLSFSLFPSTTSHPSSLPSFSVSCSLYSFHSAGYL